MFEWVRFLNAKKALREKLPAFRAARMIWDLGRWILNIRIS